jgi:hypothetical protein
MIPTPPSQAPQQLSPQQIADVVDKTGMQWVDQYNQHLALTVRAFQRLRSAFEERFINAP